MKQARRILIARTDKLGDVLMSLQSVARVRQALPEAEIDFVVRHDNVPVLAGFARDQRVRLLEWKFILEAEYDAALCLFDDPILLGLLKARKVKVRVGNYSKLRSFIKLSHGVRQRRAQGKKNEGEYNLELTDLFLETLGAKSPTALPRLVLPVDDKAKSEAQKALAHVGIIPGQNYWIAHPGMGGSALNMGVAAYVQLLSELEKNQQGTLVLTLGPAPADLRLVEAIVDTRSDWRVLSRVSLEGLAEVFRSAALVVAPSTGPLHLAHYVGSATLGIYSPVRSHQPKRWEPWGGTGRSSVLVPQNACPGKRDCLGKACAHYYCVDKLAGVHLPSTLGSVLKRA